MLGTKSSIIIILFFITFISSTLIIPTTSQTQFQANIRYLQINSPTTKTIQQQLNKTIEYANSYRVDNKLSSITLNSNAARILNQWQTIMKSFMSLQQYFQLYGIMNVYFQVFTSIPEDYVSKVIVKLSQGLIYGTYNQYALYYRELDAGNKQITFVFLGGPEAKNNKISEDLIGKTIQDIKLQEDQANKLTAQAQTPSVVNTQPQTPTVVNTQPQTPSVVNTQPQTPSVVNTQPQTPSVVNTQPQTPSVVNTQPQTPSVVNTQPQTPSVVNTRPQTPSTVNTQPQTPSVVNTQPQTPSVVNTQPQTPSVVNTQPQTPSVVNTQPQTPSTVNTQPQTPSVVNTQPQTPSVVNTQPQTSSSLTTSSISSSTIKPSNPNIYITNNPQQISQVFIKSPSILSSQFPLLPSPIIQTTFCNTTYYPNIILSHCLPKSFLKDEIFPFRGKITVPNPTGMSVNVIYTRVSDQLRLAFSQYLRPNNTSFQILAELNMTGNYYLSVFVGRSGIAAANTFTISPSFIGSIVSRAPSAIKSASLNLMNNDLWLNWTYSDVSQPAITQIIFTQDGGKKKEFLISNYQTEFKIPFSHFYDFYSGTTDIQITQAFSSNQSAISRTSFFSAPYSLIFTATTHHYDIIKKNDFDPIPLKINQKNFITLSGTTSTDMQNQIVILTPDKKFVSQYINPKNQSQKIKAGTKLNVSIQFNTTGVHILQVNDAGGQAIINVPIYVGDIIPLIPDFMDLNPKYIDLQALNQPTLLDTRRSIILMLLNDVRRSFGQSNLYLDNKLNDLAQSYSATQIQYNFVGHYDMMGRGPGQRAEAAGILEGVGENIAVNNNLTNAQLMLQRSPIHLRNMVSPLWTRVGLGIVQNPNQMYYLTQQFSSRDLTLNPLTSSEISAIQGQILNFITNKYPNITGEDKGLSSILSSYQNLSSRPYIITYLNGFGYKNFGVANVKASYNNGDYMQLITNGSNFEPTSTSFKLVGISVTYSDGSLEIFAAYI